MNKENEVPNKSKDSSETKKDTFDFTKLLEAFNQDQKQTIQVIQK